jgi:hypothetical protein
MPPVPFQVPIQVRRQAQMVLDASIRHPVFFTEKLKKAPNGVAAGNTGWGSPVATGYVFNDGVRREGESRL